jgi:hypothetical protein
MNVYICSIWIDVVEWSFCLISIAALEIKSSIRDYSRVCLRQLDEIKIQTFNFLPAFGSHMLLIQCCIGLKLSCGSVVSGI